MLTTIIAIVVALCLIRIFGLINIIAFAGFVLMLILLLLTTAV